MRLFSLLGGGWSINFSQRTPLRIRAFDPVRGVAPDFRRGMSRLDGNRTYRRRLGKVRRRRRSRHFNARAKEASPPFAALRFQTARRFVTTAAGGKWCAIQAGSATTSSARRPVGQRENQARQHLHAAFTTRLERSGTGLGACSPRSRGAHGRACVPRSKCDGPSTAP